MIKSFRNKLVAFLVVCFIACVVALSQMGVPTVFAEGTTDVSSVTINVDNVASIKTNDPMGIKFRASISTRDYSGLNESYKDVIYGMMLAPKDYVKSADMNVDGWKVDGTGADVVEYQGELTSGVYYFQNKEITPIYNEDNDCYELYGAFVNVNVENYDREFVVTAYVAAKNDTDANYTYKYSNKASRTVYTVATGALAHENFTGDVKTYLEGVVDSVYTANTGAEYTFRTINLTSGKTEDATVENGENFKVVATHVNTYGDVIEAIAKVTGNEITDNGDGTYTAYSGGGFKFDFTATIEGTDGKVSEIFTVAGEEQEKSYDYLTHEQIRTVDETHRPISDATATLPSGVTAPFADAAVIKQTHDGEVDKPWQIRVLSSEISEGCFVTFAYYNADGQFNPMLMGPNNSYTKVYNAFYYCHSSGFSSGAFYPTDSENYGIASVKHYNANGDLISGATEYRTYKGQWCFVEVEVSKLYNTDNICFGRQQYGSGGDIYFQVIVSASSLRPTPAN